MKKLLEGARLKEYTEQGDIAQLTQAEKAILDAPRKHHVMFRYSRSLSQEKTFLFSGIQMIALKKGLIECLRRFVYWLCHAGRTT